MRKRIIALSVLLALIICFVILSLIRFPYEAETLASHKAGELVTISGKSYVIVEIKQTANATSIHYILKEDNDYFVVSFKRFPYWNRYASSPVIPLEEGVIYEYPDYFCEGMISGNGDQISFTQQKHISWQVFSLPLALLVAIIAIFCLPKSIRK